MARGVEPEVGSSNKMMEGAATIPQAMYRTTTFLLMVL